MSAYQEQKDDLEGTSRISLVIRALMRIVGLSESDKWTSSDVSDMSTERVKVNASQISKTITILLAEESDGEDEGEDESEGQKPQNWPNPKAVGIILSKLRLPKDRDTSQGRARHRLISQVEVIQLAIAHHLVQLNNNLSETSKHVHMSEDRRETRAKSGDGAEPSERDGCSSSNGNMSDMSETCPTCGAQDWGEWMDGRRLCMACLQRGA